MYTYTYIYSNRIFFQPPSSEVPSLPVPTNTHTSKKITESQHQDPCNKLLEEVTHSNKSDHTPQKQIRKGKHLVSTSRSQWAHLSINRVSRITSHIQKKKHTLGLHIKTFFNELLQQVIPTLSRKFRQQIPSLRTPFFLIFFLNIFKIMFPVSPANSVQQIPALLSSFFDFCSPYIHIFCPLLINLHTCQYVRQMTPFHQSHESVPPTHIWGMANGCHHDM